MKLVRLLEKEKYFCRNLILDNSGNSMPIVMIIMLVVMIIGSAVAYSTVQIFTIVRNSEHNEMTYIAAESAIERCLSNLDTYLTKEEFPSSRGIAYINEKEYIDDIVDYINSHRETEIKKSYSIPVYAASSMNEAQVSMFYSWDGATYSRNGNKLKFPLQITAKADMENGIFKSYERKAVAVNEYEVWIYNPFKLNGAIYTLGDFVAKDSGSSNIVGNVYVFGTGFDQANRMDQYNTGGICSVDQAKLRISGSAYTRNLLRVGRFEDTGSEQCAIVVDKNVVAHSIQAFGRNDNIVITGDAYTFDDLEMNGADSYIAINGDFFGMNRGNGCFHDASSAVINTSPMYAAGTANEFTMSRIVINGSVFVNGSTYRLETDGTAEYQLEDVALAWEGNQPVYIAEGEDCIDQQYYINNVLFKSGGGERNGFSVLLGNVGWSNAGDPDLWNSWINEIKSKINPSNYRNNIGISVPDKITGFCNYAMASNNKVYRANKDNIRIPSSITCDVAEDVEGLEEGALNSYLHVDANESERWNLYTSDIQGIPNGLSSLNSILASHVEVFSRKEYSASGLIEYNFNAGYNYDSEFLRIRDALNDIDMHRWGCIVKFDDVADSQLNLIDYLETEKYTDPSAPYINHYLLIINLDPDMELVVDRDVNGIIFTMGKVTITNGATVNGSIVAAGMGYDPDDKVKGSAADFYDGDKPRLPRVVGTENLDIFKNWGYAALILDGGGGSVHFPGRDDLFDEFESQNAGFKEILEGIF